MTMVRYENKDFNLYSLVVNNNGHSFVLPILFKGEKWRLIATTKKNLKKYGFSRFLVPKGKGEIGNIDIYKNSDWYIC